MQKAKHQTFNDGICNIYTVKNIAEEGNMPIDGLTLKVGPLRYEDRIVGMGRYWTAAQAQVKIDNIIRTPLMKDVSSQDVAVLQDGRQYKIKQVQYVKDVLPEAMDLSLERLEAAYEIKRV